MRLVSMGEMFDREKLFDPVWNALAALRYVKARYGRVDSSSPVIEQMERTIEEGTMAGIELRAPVNPYRVPERDDSLGRLAAMEAVSLPPFSGPGLLGADIDRIARAHHQQGYREGEADQMKHTREAQGRLADAFDEGFVAGRIERARGLARDFHVRLMEPLVSMVALHSVIVVKASTKKQIAEAFNRHETAMREVESFAEAMMDDPRKSLVDDPHTGTAPA